MTLDALTAAPPGQSAVLDDAHIGDITGALGTIRHDDTYAGGVATYTQAGQNFGTSLLWTLPLLIPVLIVNQEMVVRLGAVTGVGHARLIRERFGKFWATFSVADLFVLNFLTIATEFIGVILSLEYF